MKFYYQVLTTPTADTPGTSVLLHFPSKRYIFGQISEGTQRACTENGTRLSSVSDIFISGRMEWDNTGGLIGMILTKADARASSVASLEAHEKEKAANRVKLTGVKDAPKNGKPSAPNDDFGHSDLTVHGARNLAHTLATARRFVFRKGLPIYTKEYDADSVTAKLGSSKDDQFKEPTWSDENIRVWAMPVSRSAASPRSQSPKKRSLDEFREDNKGLVEVDQQRKDQLVRESVVSHMFDSDWTLDSLEETELADVKMPAQIFVRDPETKDLKKYSGPLPGGNEKVPDIRVLVRKPWPGASIGKLPTATKCEDSMCYIIKNYDLRGKLDPKKARALGIKPGPILGAFTRGESVTTEDGKVVTPDMVLGPSIPGKGVAIIDLPNAQYVESLVTRPEWKSPSVVDHLESFIWILGPGVGDHPRLREFVASMSQCKHTVSSPDYCPNYLSFQSVAASSMRMARLRSPTYAIPVHDNESVPQRQLFMKNYQPVPSFEAADPGLIFRMVPELELIKTEVVPRLNPATVLEKMPVAAEGRANKISAKLQHPRYQKKIQQYQKDLPGADVEIFTLGTGSSAPSKYRNVSSTLIHVPGKGYYLFDSGEGTIGQLKRMFKPDELREVLQNLRMIWVSHLHADHHLGTVSVIKAWYQENYPGGAPLSDGEPDGIHKALEDNRLAVLSDSMMIEWLEEYAGVEDYGFGKILPLSAYPYREGDEIKTSLLYRHCHANGSYPGKEIEDYKPVVSELRFDKEGNLTDLVRKATGLNNILTTYVSHCRGSMAVSLVFDDGFKISFSGDCRPSPSFAEIGKDSTVLIHEATFGNEMAGSAIAKKHSTISEAIRIGRKMRARAILLTHFSQRYQKVAYYDTNEEQKREDKDFNSSKNYELRMQEHARQREAAAAAMGIPPSTPDAPVDKEQEDLAAGSPEIAKKAASEAAKPPPPIVPIVAAFDHMRVRVGDMYTLEHYAPAVNKLFEALEKSNYYEDQMRKNQRTSEANAQKAKLKAGRHAQWEAKMSNEDEKAKAFARAQAEAKAKGKGASPPGSPTSQGSRRHSVWSAPDSESGWWDSDSSSESKKGASSR